MQFSVAKDIFGSPWHLDASGFQQYYPVVLGMMNGAVIMEEDEPKENLPFALSADTKQPVMWSEPEDDDDDDTEPKEETSREKVVHVLPVRGILMKHDMTCGPRGSRTLANRLLNADAEPSVIGHVMIIEGPGGAANAVPELADAMQKCKKPIVVWVDGMMASAHMYVGSYGKEILASRGTDVIGCIGTMIVYQGRKSKSDEDSFKTREVTIYADESFEKNEEYEKAINDFDFKLVKERILNPHARQFINDIKSNRPGVEDIHLHGRTFPAMEVIGSLIDRIGSFDDAVNRVIELSAYKKENNAGSNGSQAIVNNQKISTMKYPKIQSTLGYDSIELEADGRRTFTTEEMEAVETALANNSSEELQSQLDQANTNLQNVNSQVTEREQTIAERDQTIVERDQTIENLTQQIAELKNEPAEQPAVVAPASDSAGSNKPGPVSDKYEDLGDQLQAVSQEYLNKKL